MYFHFQLKASSQIHWKETPEVHYSCKTTGTSTGFNVCSAIYWWSGSDLQIKFWCGGYAGNGSTAQLTISEGKIRRAQNTVIFVVITFTKHTVQICNWITFKNSSVLQKCFFLDSVSLLGYMWSYLFYLYHLV